MIYISISVTLITMLAAIFVMAKAKSESWGTVSKLVTWIVLLTSAAILVCQIARGIHIMRSGDRCSSSETCLSKKGCHDEIMIKEVRKMRGGHCNGDEMMRSMCCGKGECKGIGECGGKCGGKMGCCGKDSECCGSGTCKGTGDCGGKCGEKMSCCHSMTDSSGTKVIKIEAEVTE